MKTIEDVLIRLRAEFLEMPGLSLTTQQVRHLCGVEPETCHMVLDLLVDVKFLCVTPNGTYARLTEAEVSHIPVRQTSQLPGVPGRYRDS